MEKAEQETEYGRSQLSQYVSGVSRPSLPIALPEQETEYGRSQLSQYVSGVSLPSARPMITLSVQELEHIDRNEDCSCMHMQHTIIPFCAMAEGES